ncbi:unnamed protein product [Lactuca saligna]|uniref:Uncharacterized protein n=1 Tax=Lactuca saligna TaxID=75948 RepID=A0AA36EHH5_LACSI|nr:unnamed protein product [Lactuca saligna]
MQILYVWMLYSFAQGDTLRRWRTEPFIMITDGYLLLCQQPKSPKNEEIGATFAAGRSMILNPKLLFGCCCSELETNFIHEHHNLKGFNVETIEYKNISFTVWDVGDTTFVDAQLPEHTRAYLCG